MPRTRGKLTKINVKPLIQSQIITYSCGCNTLLFFHCMHLTLYIIIVVSVVSIIQGCLLGDMAILGLFLT